MELSKIYAEQKEHMEKCIAALKRDFMTIRSGKVSTTILDNIHVDYYGTPTGLSQVATVLATDATTITISPWEKKMPREIEKAIMQANIGVNPNNDGETIKLSARVSGRKYVFSHRETGGKIIARENPFKFELLSDTLFEAHFRRQYKL